MADIISIKNKLEEAKLKKAKQVRYKKVLGAGRVMVETFCDFRCEKCHAPVDESVLIKDESERHLRVPYIFCDHCATEYVEYIEYLKGNCDPDKYWHNESWLDVWSKWIAYQGSLDYYFKTGEFIQLLEELKDAGADQ